jgi:hypothetical protein
MNTQKIKIAKEWEYITFTEMQGVEERSIEELTQVLAFEKSLRGISQ